MTDISLDDFKDIAVSPDDAYSDDIQQDIEAIELIDASLESVTIEMQRGLALYNSLNSLDKDPSMESFDCLTERLEVMLTSSGISVPATALISFEADEPNDKPEVEATADGPKEEPKKKPSVKKTMGKVWAWLQEQWKVFVKWMGERGKKIKALKDKIFNDSKINDEVFKGM